MQDNEPEARPVLGLVQGSVPEKEVEEVSWDETVSAIRELRVVEKVHVDVCKYEKALQFAGEVIDSFLKQRDVMLSDLKFKLFTDDELPGYYDRMWESKEAARFEIKLERIAELIDFKNRIVDFHQLAVWLQMRTKYPMSHIDYFLDTALRALEKHHCTDFMGQEHYRQEVLPYVQELEFFVKDKVASFYDMTSDLYELLHDFRSYLGVEVLRSNDGRFLDSRHMEAQFTQFYHEKLYEGNSTEHGECNCRWCIRAAKKEIAAFLTQAEPVSDSIKTRSLFEVLKNSFNDPTCGCRYCSLVLSPRIFSVVISMIEKKPISDSTVEFLRRIRDRVHGLAKNLVGEILNWTHEVQGGAFSTGIGLKEEDRQVALSLIHAMNNFKVRVDADSVKTAVRESLSPMNLLSIFEDPRNCLLLMGLVLAVLAFGPKNKFVYLICIIISGFVISRADVVAVFKEAQTVAMSAMLFMFPDKPENFEMQMDAVKDTTAWVSIIAQVLSLGVFGGMLNVSSIEKAGESFVKYDRAVESTSRFFARLETLFHKIIAQLSEQFNLKWIEEHTGFDKHLESVEKDFVSVLSLYSFHAESGGKYPVNQATANRIKSVYNSVVEMLSKVPKTKEFVGVVHRLERMVSELKPLVTAVESAGFKMGARNVPNMLFVAGNAGCGKTTNMDYVLTEIMTSDMNPVQLVDFETNRNSHIYVPVQGSSYWEGYRHQKCIYSPDAFSAADAAGQESMATFLIQAIGTNDFPLNMAFEGKGGTFMTSDLIVLVSNFYSFASSQAVMFKSIHNFDALARRVNANAWLTFVDVRFRGELVPSEEYIRLPGEKEADMLKFQYRVSKRKIAEYNISVGRKAEDFCPEALHFQRYDCIRGVLKGETYTLAEFQELQSKMNIEHHAHSQALAKCLDNYTKEVVSRRLREAKTTRAAVALQAKQFAERGFSNPDWIAAKEPRDEVVQAVEDMNICVMQSDFDVNFEVFSEVPDYLKEDQGSVSDDSVCGIDYRPALLEERSKVSDTPDILEQADYEHLKRSFKVLGVNPSPYAFGEEICESYKDARVYLKEYVDHCFHDNVHPYRYKREEYESKYGAFRDRPCHAIWAVLEEATLEDLMEIVNYQMSDVDLAYANQVMSCLNSREKRQKVSFWKSWRLSIRLRLEQAKQRVAAIYSGKDSVVNWISGLPAYVKVVGGVAMLGVVFSTLFGVCKWFFSNSSEVEYFEEQAATYYEELPANELGKSRVFRNGIAPVVSNQFKFVLAVPVEGGHSVSNPGLVFGLFDHTYACPNHFKTMIQDGLKAHPLCEVWMKRVDSRSVEAPWKILAKDLSSFVPVEGFDMCTFNIPSNRNRCTDMWSRLPSIKQVEYFKLLEKGVEGAFIVRMDRKKENGERLEGTYTILGTHEGEKVKFQKLSMPVVYNKYDNTSVSLSLHAEYVAVGDKGKTSQIFLTEVGDCGSVGVVFDPMVKGLTSRGKGYELFQNPVPAYMHVSLYNSSMPVGVMLYREMFEPVLKFKTSSIKSTIDSRLDEIDDMIELFKEQMDNVAFVRGRDANPEVSGFGSHHVVHRKFSEKSYLVGKTGPSQITKSPLYGLDPDIPSEKRPASLMPKLVKLDDGFIVKKPMVESRFGYGNNPQLVNAPLVDHIGRCFSKTVFERSTAVTEDMRRVKPFEECVLAVDRSKSPGFQLSVVKNELKQIDPGDASLRARYWLLGEEEKYDLERPNCKKLKAVIDKQIAQMEAGDRVYTVYNDCLKDELRPPGKMTRMFCAGDLVFLLQTMMYFGAFAEWIFANRIKNFMAIGVNPYSIEWHEMFIQLTVFTKTVFADFGKFDKRLLQAFICCTRTLIRQFYGEGDPAANMVREMLFEDFLNTFHASFQDGSVYIYEWDLGNTSGNFLTTIINSVAGLIMLFYCVFGVLLGSYDKLLLALPQQFPWELILKNMSPMQSGDDAVYTFSDYFYKCGVHFNSIKVMVEQATGGEYQDELKASGEVPDYRDIHEGTFLARSFVWTDFTLVPRVVGALRLISITEPWQWWRKVKDKAILLLVVQNCIVELAPRGREYFLPGCLGHKLIKLANVLGVPVVVDWESAMREFVSREGVDYRVWLGQWSQFSQQPENCAFLIESGELSEI